MNWRLSIIAITISLLGGCSLAPEYEQPQSTLPDSFSNGKSSESQAISDAQLETWWTAFGDDVLNALIERALTENFDLQAAAQRVLAARANLGFAKANQWPTLTGNSTIARQDYPNTLNPNGASQGGPQDSFQLIGMLDYEIDLWGKLANASNASREELLATAYSYETVRTTLAAEVATTYFMLLATQRQVAITEDTIRSRQEAFDIQSVRRDSGAITELEKQQAAAELAAANAELPSLNEQASLLTTSLAVLVGASPKEIWSEPTVQENRFILPPPPQTNLDQAPVSLLARRPDIVAAESQARALTYQIGVVKAERWPTVTVGALGGLISDPMGKVFSDDNATWSITGMVTGTLYDFGRNAARVEASEAYQNEALIRYEQVVQQAFRELKDAVDQLNYSERRIDARRAHLDAINLTVDLAQSRYRAGLTSYLDLLSAQNTQFNVELTLVNAWLDRYLASVELYKALGGGWEVPAKREDVILVGRLDVDQDMPAE
ncbi:efflux transporter outer membrane subunit [Cerasicoccus frondis]|uniref:efflux transporter outer membrane subunit n=1 Tax=Cerasicoccus frondis TaxID=490090 RepID=UPI00285272E6|nr:efflux transporter outer membrane subunit [Cerasicoccus frondis]